MEHYLQFFDTLDSSARVDKKYWINLNFVKVQNVSFSVL